MNALIDEFDLKKEMKLIEIKFVFYSSYVFAGVSISNNLTDSIPSFRAKLFKDQSLLERQIETNLFLWNYDR